MSLPLAGVMSLRSFRVNSLHPPQCLRLASARSLPPVLKNNALCLLDCESFSRFVPAREQPSLVHAPEGFAGIRDTAATQALKCLRAIKKIPTFR